jgi:hypothetical protein
MLSQLEQFAYFSEGITFMVHEAEHPYLLCLVGEKLSIPKWRELGKVIHQLQRKYLRREKAGRPPDLDRLNKLYSELEQPGSLKGKAYEVRPKPTEKQMLQSRESSLESSQVYVSRKRKELKH